MRPYIAKVLAAVLSVVAVPVWSQQIGIYPDLAGHGECVDAEQNELLQLYVVVKQVPVGGPSSISAVRFRQPQATCGVFYWEFTPIFPLTYIGSDVIVEFERCLPLPVHVLTVQAVGLSRSNCCFIGVEPVSARDCEGNDVTMLGGYSGFSTLVDTLCQYIPPDNPHPPDGATFVSTDVTFSWSESPGPNYCANIDWYGIALGRTPDPPGVYFSSDTFYDPPYRLEENTTYYWRVSVWGNGPGVSSPLWSFSTGGTVSIHQSTWGKIKALYR